MSAGLAGPILLVESDRQLAHILAEQLIADGFAVELARTVAHARILARASEPALTVLGSLESSAGALELLREIRREEPPDDPWDSAMPVVVLGSGAREHELLRAFEAGADDYLAWPANYLELRARLRAILRRSGEARAGSRFVVLDALVIDTSARTVTVDARRVELRRMEFELLAHLAQDPRRVYSRGELLRAVWRYRSSCSSRTVDSHASRLRRKLAHGGEPRWVISVWGVGYRLI